MKKRITINLSEELHRRAVVHAESSHYTDFSGLVTKLLVEDLERRGTAADDTSRRHPAPADKEVRARGKVNRVRDAAA